MWGTLGGDVRGVRLAEGDETKRTSLANMKIYSSQEKGRRAKERWRKRRKDERKTKVKSAKVLSRLVGPAPSPQRSSGLPIWAIRFLGRGDVPVFPHG
jgi:hypothetical protein